MTDSAKDIADAKLLLEGVQAAILKGYKHYKKGTLELLPTVEDVIKTLKDDGAIYVRKPGEPAPTEAHEILSKILGKG